MIAAEAPSETELVLAMAMLPDVGPARLLALTDGRQASRAWKEIVEGRAHRGPAAAVMGADPRALALAWARAAESLDPNAILRRHLDAGLVVATRADAGYPDVLRDDPHGPALLVWRGTLSALDGPRVAIVGTRDCTHAGREFASELGRELSDLGVRVVSGLALGIDGAAHAGALSTAGAPPIGVVGSGLDIVYPRRHGQLWRRVAEAGLLLSEHPLGAEPVGWHFLARNRIIAALADVVVVVESHEHGGALQTATEAANRGRAVLAVPGSIRSPASRGSNALLADAGVCCEAADVLTALGLVAPTARERRVRPAPSDGDAVVLDAIGWEPCAIDQLLLRTGRSLGELTLALDRLEHAGWVVRRGGWTERVGPTTERHG
jgi:DNA processing protein